MIPKKRRLPRTEFRARSYRTVATPFFSLKIKNNALPHNRIGVVVGISVDKRATRRNFWKRQAKAALLRVPDGGPADSKDLLMIMFPKINTLTTAAFREEIKKTLQ